GLDAIQGDGGRALPVVADVSSRSRANPSGRHCWHRRTMSLSAATVSPSPPSSARPYRRFRLVIHGKPAKGFSRLPARKKFFAAPRNIPQRPKAARALAGKHEKGL